MPQWYTPSEDPLHPTSERDPSNQYPVSKDGGTVLEQFAKSHHGREIYHLQEDGLPLAEDQRSMTTFQKNVYLISKSYWSEKERDEAESNAPSKPSGANKYL